MTLNFDELTEDQVAFAEAYYSGRDGSQTARQRFAEALALPQLPKLMQPILDAEIMDNIGEKPTIADRFSTVETIDQVNRWVEWQNFDVKTDAPNENNGETYYGGLPKKLPEQPYSKLYFAESNKFLRTVLRGLSVDIQFETIYNSRGAKIDLIPRAINRFLTESRDTDEIEATRVLVTSAGINTATLGTTGHVAVSGGVTNPPLTLTTTVQVIADAIAQALLFQINGRDVDFQRFALVVPPAKVPVIKQALTGMRVTIVPGSTGGVSMTQEIDLGAAVDVVGNKWLKTIYPSIGEGWFLVPTDGTLPTIVRAKLEGHEAPQVWVEGSNAFYYPAGGNVPELQGNFTDETWSSKVRYAVEGHAFFSEGVVYSNGTGL